jgi:hypothetical protein
MNGLRAAIDNILSIAARKPLANVVAAKAGWWWALLAAQSLAGPPELLDRPLVVAWIAIQVQA